MNVEKGTRIRYAAGQLDGFLIGYQKKVAGRVAVVDNVYTRLGEHSPSARVTWQKRGNRGKEFAEHIGLTSIARYMEIAP